MVHMIVTVPSFGGREFQSPPVEKGVRGNTQVFVEL